MDAPAMGPGAQEMLRLLRELNPTKVELIDDSEKHRGHGGYNPAGESHFSLLVESPLFSGKSRAERQRMVHSALGDMVGERVHALSIRARAPGESAGP
jgi:BolA protein